MIMFYLKIDNNIIIIFQTITDNNCCRIKCLFRENIQILLIDYNQREKRKSETDKMESKIIPIALSGFYRPIILFDEHILKHLIPKD